MKSELGVALQDTIDKVKLMKGHKTTKDKLEEMSQAVAACTDPGFSMVKKAYQNGVKTAEDMAAANEDFDISKEEESKASRVLRKLRVGWGDKAYGACNREKNLDTRQQAAEDEMGMTQINSNSPELQEFSTSAT